MDYFEENNIPVPTRTELAWLSIIFRIVIICIAPGSFFIYHSRLLTLDAFLHLKKHQYQIRSDGEIIYRRGWHFRVLFCCSSMRKQNYVEYVLWRNKVKHWYELVTEIMTTTIIFIILFYYFWNETIDEFKLPWYYLFMICLLIAQKQVIFLIKALTFFPVYCTVRRCPCIRRGRQRQQTENQKLMTMSINPSPNKALDKSAAASSIADESSAHLDETKVQ